MADDLGDEIGRLYDKSFRQQHGRVESWGLLATDAFDQIGMRE